MSSPVSEARKRQLARLGGAKPPTPRAAMALAKSQAYQDAADAPATLRAYATDLANYRAWCERHGFDPMPATPEIVGAYLAAAGEGYALPTLRRRVAAIARACGVDGHPLDTKHPSIRETLRGIARRKHWRTSPPISGADHGRSQENWSRSLRHRPSWCMRDRALVLVGFAGAMRRSELVALDVEHRHLDGRRHETPHRAFLKDRRRRRRRRDRHPAWTSRPETCPVTALLQQWLTDSRYFRRADISKR